MRRSFNTAGPCLPDRHYMVPPLERFPEELTQLIDAQQYFILHAPSRAGKTTTIHALAEMLTAQGKYVAVAVSCETAACYDEQEGMAQRSVLSEIRLAAEFDLPEELRPPQMPDGPDETLLQDALQAWARSCPRPLVLFLDEFDALVGRSLISVLNQLRNGFHQRPSSFPWSVILCARSSIPDYKSDVEAWKPALRAESAPFDTWSGPFLLEDFTIDQIARLYDQHTADTGQLFTDDAIECAYHLSDGQPWFVNALANEIVDERKMAVLVKEPIVSEHLTTAKDRLIASRSGPLDLLPQRVRIPRVHRIVAPLSAGQLAADHESDANYPGDLALARDLGLIKLDPLRIANPIYRDVIRRALTPIVWSSIVS